MGKDHGCGRVIWPQGGSHLLDPDINTNPYELGLDRLVNTEIEADFIGKAALKRIRDAGVSRKQVGLKIDCAPLQGPNTSFWPLGLGEKTVGKVTSAVYSPRLKQNIALAMVDATCTEIGTVLEVITAAGSAQATVVERPFFDPKKKIAVAA